MAVVNFLDPVTNERVTVSGGGGGGSGDSIYVSPDEPDKSQFKFRIDTDEVGTPTSSDQPEGTDISEILDRGGVL